MVHVHKSYLGYDFTQEILVGDDESNIESLQAMRAEASRHIEFIERNRERFEVEEKAAE